MSKTIAVVADFLTEQHRQQILDTATPLGWAVDFYRVNADAYGKVADCEILFGHCQGKLIRSASSMRWLSTCYAGVDRMCDDELYQNPDCILTNSAGAYGVTISEHLVMVTLMMLRRMPEYTESIAQRGWENLGKVRSIQGARVLVMGTGNIGTTFAQRVRSFAPASLIGVRRRAEGEFDPAFDAVYPISRLEELLPETDIVAMCMPGTAETVGLLSRERITLLPKGAYIANIGRGSAIDQDALMEALNNGHLAGAALDVVEPEPLPADHPLRDTKNLLLTPHISGNTTLGYTCDTIVNMFCENLVRYHHGEPLHHVVNRRIGY